MFVLAQDVERLGCEFSAGPALHGRIGEQTLDPECENPFDLTGWRHPKLLQWAKQHRPDLIWAALTLVQAWIAEGMPPDTLTLGNFESWAEVMSSICNVVGLDGLHANWREWHEGQPSDLPVLRKVWATWRSEFGDQKVKAAELLPVIGPIIDLDAETSTQPSPNSGSA